MKQANHIGAAVMLGLLARRIGRARGVKLAVNLDSDGLIRITGDKAAAVEMALHLLQADGLYGDDQLADALGAESMVGPRAALDAARAMAGLGPYETREAA